MHVEMKLPKAFITLNDKCMQNQKQCHSDTIYSFVHHRLWCWLLLNLKLSCKTTHFSDADFAFHFRLAFWTRFTVFLTALLPVTGSFQDTVAVDFPCAWDLPDLWLDSLQCEAPADSTDLQMNDHQYFWPCSYPTQVLVNLANFPDLLSYWCHCL